MFNLLCNFPKRRGKGCNWILSHRLTHLVMCFPLFVQINNRCMILFNLIDCRYLLSTGDHQDPLLPVKATIVLTFYALPKRKSDEYQALLRARVRWRRVRSTMCWFMDPAMEHAVFFFFVSHGACCWYKVATGNFVEIRRS